MDAAELDALTGLLSDLGGPDAIRRMGKNLHYFVNLTGLGQQEYIVNAFPSKIETLEFCETSLTPFEWLTCHTGARHSAESDNSNN